MPNYIVPIFEKSCDLVEATEKSKRVILGKIQEGDILVVKDGSPGTVAVVTKEFIELTPNIMASYHLHIIRLKKEYRKYAHYICAFLNSKVGQALLRRYISGSVSPTIRNDEISGMKVIVPKNDNLAKDTKKAITNLQNSIITVMNKFLEPSKKIETKNNNLPKLPINWMPGGKRDKHGYYRP